MLFTDEVIDIIKANRAAPTKVPLFIYLAVRNFDTIYSHLLFQPRSCLIHLLTPT